MRPVDRVAFECRGERVEVEVPAGEHLGAVFVGELESAREREQGAVAMGREHEAQRAVDVSFDREDPRRVELGDHAVHHGAVTLLVGVLPLDDGLAAGREIDVEGAPPLDHLAGIGDRAPDALDRGARTAVRSE